MASRRTYSDGGGAGRPPATTGSPRSNGLPEYRKTLRVFIQCSWKNFASEMQDWPSDWLFAVTWCLRA